MVSAAAQTAGGVHEPVFLHSLMHAGGTPHALRSTAHPTPIVFCQRAMNKTIHREELLFFFNLIEVT